MRSTLLTVLALVTPLTAQAQEPGASPWRGTLSPPTGPSVELTYHVGAPGARRLAIAGTRPGSGERTEATDLVTSGADLRFRFDRGGSYRCTLEVPVRGGYAGSCVDEKGAASRLVIEPPVPGMLHPDHEMELALSAAPEAIAKAADVYVLTGTGFVKAREGRNGFSCLVERPRIGDLWPVCYDAEGTATLLQVSLERGRMRAAGKTEEAIAEAIADGYRTGRFRPARRNGIAFMISTMARSLDASSGKTATLTPHLMFYAPFVTRDDIGQHPEADERMPVVMGSGRPDALIIVRLPGYGPPGR